MKADTARKIGAIIAFGGGLAADVATTIILKRYAPEVTKPLHKLALAAGIGFIGYAVGSNVDATVNRDVESIVEQAEKAKLEAQKAVYINVDINKEG